MPHYGRGWDKTSARRRERPTASTTHSEKTRDAASGRRETRANATASSAMASSATRGCASIARALARGRERVGRRDARARARMSDVPAHESSLAAMGLTPERRTGGDVRTTRMTFTTSATCPFAHRCWLALTELDAGYDLDLVNLEAKTEAFETLFARAAPDARANPSVPILTHDGTIMVESALILKYISETFEREGKSIRASGKTGYYGQLFADTFQQCVPVFFKMLRATNEADLGEAVDAFVAGLKKANRVLELGAAARAWGPYACGEQFTTCDIMAMTFVPRFEIVLAHYRDFNLRETLARNECSALEKWIDAVSSRPSLVYTFGEITRLTGKTHEQAFVDHFAKFVTWRSNEGRVAT